MTLNQIADMGSSPRMRGSLEHFTGVYKGTGIIPAHAGLTSYRLPFDLDNRDHPRACGAHASLIK